MTQPQGPQPQSWQSFPTNHVCPSTETPLVSKARMPHPAHPGHPADLWAGELHGDDEQNCFRSG